MSATFSAYFVESFFHGYLIFNCPNSLESEHGNYTKNHMQKSSASAGGTEITNEGAVRASSRPSGCWDVSRGGAQSAKRAKPPLPPCCGRGISEPHCDGVPAFARYKSILRMYLVGTESIGRLMPTNLSVCARMSAQWYCATFRGAASSLGRHPALNICQRLFASCMRM